MNRLVNNPLKEIRRFVDSGQWRNAVALDASQKVTPGNERALPYVLVAALELREIETIERLVESAATKPVSPEIAVAMATRLITWGHSDNAWRLLSQVQTFDNKRQLAALCHRISIKSADTAVRAAAKAKFLSLIGGDGAVAAVEAKAANWPDSSLAEFQFPQALSPAPLPGLNFRFDIQARAGVLPEHATQNAELMTKFNAKIDRNPQPKVYKFDNVFVNRFGQMWRPNGDVVMSSNRPIPELKPGEPTPEFDRAVLCTNATRGFYHWYAERLPSLAWVVNTGQLEAPILFGSHAAKFQDDTMSLLDVGPAGFARVGDAAFCKTAYVGHISLACLADWSRYSGLYDTLADNAEKRAGPLTASRMIYISRRDSDRRAMGNEIELESRLAAMGVESIIFSKLPLADQITLIRRAKVVIGAHGAGMTHILNASAGLRVLELMPSQPGYHALRFNYARISRLRGHWHTLWLEPINPATRDWAVDIDRVCALAESIIEGA